MKKTIALPLIAAIALGTAACSKNEADNGATANTEASADMNAAATDAIADVNAASENASENAMMSAGNGADMNASDTNASNAM